MTQPSGSVLEGWMVGPEAASCSAACSAAGLMCSEGAQMSHNDEIDSDYDMDLVLSSLNQSTCYWHEHAFNSNGNVPSFSPNLSPNWFGAGKSWCAISDPGRLIDTYDCNDPAPADAHRLCYCSPPSPTVKKTMDKPVSSHKLAKKQDVSKKQRAAEGWIVGGPGRDCLQACTAISLRCTEAAQEAHNFEVDSDTEIDNLLSQLGEPACYWHSHTFGVNGNVANFAPHVGVDFFGQQKTWCAVSEPGRPSTSYSCAEKAPNNAKRFCYCN